MGVPGLWDLIRPAGKTRSLTHLSVVDGFEKNTDGLRGFRVGIDASIWFFHSYGGREGENPELRTLFFKCTKLMSSPFLPLFVFDGPKRPSVKRGKKVKGDAHWLTSGMKRIVEAFGFEWRTAPGEAEAELAYLNRIGVIDAVLSDDVDNFLFGATMVIRNPSLTLTGNKTHLIKNTDGKYDTLHTYIYTSASIAAHPSVQLTRGGLILIGLLSGGDYHEAGLPRCGPKFAHGLAKCGFGDSLLNATRTLPRSSLPDFLTTWRDELRQELRTNSRGHIGRKNPSLASSVPDSFPNIDILLSYTDPITSETDGRGRNLIKITWDSDPNLGKIGALCEQYFEWGYKARIIKRFRSFMWPAFVCRILRRGVLDTDKEGTPPPTPQKARNDRPPPTGTPSKMISRHFSKLNINDPCTDDDDEDEHSEERLIVRIHSSREHASTDGILEYRLEIAPAQLVRLTVKGLLGTRPPLLGSDDDDEEDFQGSRKGKAKKPPPDPDSHLRIWMPASMVKRAEPYLVDEYEGIERKKLEKKSRKGTSESHKTKIVEVEESLSILAPAETKKPVKGKRRAPKATKILQYSSSEDDTMPTFFALPKSTRSKTATDKDSFADSAVSKVPLQPTAKPAVKAKGTPDKNDLGPAPSGSCKALTKHRTPTCLELTDDEHCPLAPGPSPAISRKSPDYPITRLPSVAFQPSSRSSSSNGRVSTKTSHSQPPCLRSISASDEGKPSSLPFTRKVQPFPMSFDDAFVFASDSEDSSPPQSILANSTAKKSPYMKNPTGPQQLLRTSTEVVISPKSNNFVPGRSVATKSTDTTSAVTLSRSLRTFPMPFDEELICPSVSGGSQSPKRPPVKQANKKPAAVSSDPDSNHERIPKSPRKTKEHVSPRARYIAYPEEEEESDAGRPASPSPLRRPPIVPLPKVTVSDRNFIDISSDSDIPLSRNKLAPLTLAKRKAQKKEAQLGTTVQYSLQGPSKLSNIDTTQGNDSIIDLT